MLKRYKCSVWPKLNVAEVGQFFDGYFETKDQHKQQIIESSPSFGIYITEVSAEGLPPSLKGEELINHGMVSTRPIVRDRENLTPGTPMVEAEDVEFPRKPRGRPRKG